MPLVQHPPAMEHILSLKVMRLRRPEFQMQQPILVEKDDPLGDLHNSQVTPHHDLISYIDPHTAAHSSLSLEGLGFVDAWALPNSFGRIHVGETFVSYISLSNHSNEPARNVHVKCEIFTGNNRQVLLDLPQSSISELLTNVNHDFIVEQLLSESGSHM